ncbi:transposase [Bdellovibrionota bacterium FG-2]
MSEVRKRKRQFEVGFKRQVVHEVESGSISLSAAARKHEISPGLINQWRDKFRGGTLNDAPSKKERNLEKELERYKVLLAEAHADREFLKKSQASAQRRKKLDTAVITGLNVDQFRKDAK